MTRLTSSWLRAFRPAARLGSSKGQTLVEMAMILPMTMVVSLGVIETSYAVLHQHVVSRISREAANLISRDVTLFDASNAIKNMTTKPVDFTNGSTLVLSVLKKGATTGTANYDKIVLYQRYSIGTLAVSSSLTTAGVPSFGPSPDFKTNNSDTDVNLRITNLPASVDVTRGGLLYIAEVFTAHAPLTPLNRFGITMPATLKSIAYF